MKKGMWKQAKKLMSLLVITICFCVAKGEISFSGFFLEVDGEEKRYKNENLK